MADQLYNFNDKLGLMFVINTIKSHLDTYLAGKISAEQLNEAISNIQITTDASLSTTSTNPIQNQAVANELEKKAPLISPEFTGTPVAPTPIEGTNSVQIATTAFVQSAINSALVGITGFDIQVVESLPESGVKGTFYFVPKTSPTSNNAYSEYVWLNGNWEYIGEVEIDLTGYVKEQQLVPIPESEIEAMFANW